MKKLLALVFALCIAFSCSSCQLTPLQANSAVGFLEYAAHALGRSQITKEENLLGHRVWEKDRYTGEYTVQGANKNGQDVIFGGASIRPRALRLSGTIHTRSGKAVLRIRQNSVVWEIPVSEGAFETELHFGSGGNYIMLAYEDFEGSIELVSAYAKVLSAEES